MKILVINCGSSSLKFAIHDIAYSVHNGQRWDSGQLLNGIISGLGGEAQCVLRVDQDVAYSGSRPISDGPAAIQWMCDLLEGHQHFFGQLKDIDAVGHRIVHGGETFTQAVRLDDSVLQQIEQLNGLAPLHNPFGVTGIRMVQQTLGKGLPMVAVFDTSFHSTLPEHARHYALPSELAKKAGIRRYGFHGIAHASLARGYARFTGQSLEQSRLVTLQLGHGCSMAAIAQGKSVETSMGLTPLEGLVMGTRSGNVDPAVVWRLNKHCSMNLMEIERLLNEQSGLLGISGRSSDMHVLLEAANRDRIFRLNWLSTCFAIAFNNFLEHIWPSCRARMPSCLAGESGSIHRRYGHKCARVWNGVDCTSTPGGMSKPFMSDRVMLPRFVMMGRL